MGGTDREKTPDKVWGKNQKPLGYRFFFFGVGEQLIEGLDLYNTPNCEQDVLRILINTLLIRITIFGFFSTYFWIA